MKTIKHLLAGLLLLAGAAGAQTWPTQTVHIIVPFTPGTGMDTIARAVAPHLSERLGQPVVVRNVPGASGNIGANQVARSNPDGHTILKSANTMLMASQIYENVPFDPLKDFAPVSMAAWGTLMLVANPASGIKTLPELLAQARANPGSINYGSPGVGTPHHMAMELFRVQTQTSMLHVPYRGTAGYTTALLSGEVNVGFLPVHVAQGFVSGGRLNALAVSGSKRHPVSPNVATFEELGARGVDVDLWYAFFVPSRTNAAVVQRLNTELAAILKLPEVASVLGNAGLLVDSSTPAELGNLMTRDYQRWGVIIQRNNIRAQ